MKYRSLKHWKYELLEGMEIPVEINRMITSKYITLSPGLLKVKAHYAWDGASFIARDTKNIMRASLFHDALCQLIGDGPLDKKYRKYADQLLRKICLEDGMSKFRANYVYFAVRMYSKFKGM